MNLGIIGFGFVGKAINNFFNSKENINIKIYDKFIIEYNNFENILNTEYLYICVPTPFINNEYNYCAINEVCEKLNYNFYKGIILLKCTVEPEFTNKLLNKYTNLKLVYNPEFLTARTANYDFENQKHIIIGSDNKNYTELIYNFYKNYYPNALISISSILEAESAKIFCNAFYATKIQIFNEFYLICRNNGADYNKVLNMMLNNNWINPMHTQVPGPDGLLSFGGACLTKDINGLNSYIKKNNGYNLVLDAVIKESELIRNK